MMDVTSAIDQFSTTVALKLRTPGSYDQNGNWVKGGETNSFITASIQPTKGRQLEDMPEGMRAEACWTIWTSHSIQLDQEVEYRGKVYRVLHLWPREIGNYTQAVLGLRHERRSSS